MGILPIEFQVDVASLPGIDVEYLVNRLGICEMLMGSFN